MKKGKFIMIAIVAFSLAVSLGYALFSQTLSINGTATAKGNFDVEFKSADVTTQIGSTGATVQISEDKNTLSINIPKLEYPGSYVEYTITTTNNGTIPAKLVNIEQQGLDSDPSIKISYSGLDELKNQVINQGVEQVFKIKVLWDESSIESSSNVEFTIKLNYEQVI